MCEKVTCQIVRDLLPNYLEGLTGEETNKAVARHLEGCETCRSLHDKLKADMAVPKFEKRDLLRLLKAIRKAKATQIILAVLGGIVLTWTVIFVMSSGFSVISPDEIKVRQVYRLSDGSITVAYTVPDLDNSMLAGISGRQFGNGDYEFEVRTSFWNRLFGRADPGREVLYEQVQVMHARYTEGSLFQVYEPLIIYYGYGKDRRELWRKGDPVEEATPEFEIYLQRGLHENYEAFLADYLWRQSVASPSPTPAPAID